MGDLRVFYSHMPELLADEEVPGALTKPSQDIARPVAEIEAVSEPHTDPAPPAAMMVAPVGSG